MTRAVVNTKCRIFFSPVGGDIVYWRRQAVRLDSSNPSVAVYSGRRPRLGVRAQMAVEGGVGDNPAMTEAWTGIVDPAWPRWASEWTVDETGPPWVAADESGSSGENLVDPRGVIAHATIRIDDRSAEPILTDLRARAG